MLVRPLNAMSTEDIDAFSRIWKQSKEAGNPEGAIRLLQGHNVALLCFDEQGVVCGAITYSLLARVRALGIGWVCIPVRHKRYGEIFNCMFDEVHKMAGGFNVFMELDSADKLNIELAQSRSFRKIPIDYMSLDMPGIPQDNKVILLVRSNGPVSNYVAFLEAWFTEAYCIGGIERDPRFADLVRQARALENKF